MNTPAIQSLGLAPTTLRGQTVVITGAGRGIGRAAAEAFGWLGANVVIAELSDEGQDLEVALRQAGNQAIFVRTDVASEDSVSKLVRAVLDTYGQLDILINNAIVIPLASVAEMSIAQWDRAIAVNLRGTFLTCRGFLPGMLERQRGVIINMVSLEAMPGLSAYIASKQGICGFSQSLAAEVGEQGVRVIPFAPGMVDTPGMRSISEGLSERLGFNQEQFYALSLHPAYDGFMPLDHAGAATAYLAAVLADEYKGEVVSGYTVLERAGLIQASMPAQEPGAANPAPSIEIVSAQAVQPDRDAQVLARQLLEVLGETETQIGKLPLFARPLARNGFKSKSGQSLQECKVFVQQLISALKAGPNPGPIFPVGRLNQEQVGAALLRLRKYYAEEPVEIARFTKDAHVLEEARATSARRTGLMDAFMASLGLKL